jgi:hypothetical protein
MVFGSGLALIALLSSGGQPILSDVEINAAVKSESGSPAPCPDTIAGTGSCGCKWKCNPTLMVYHFENNKIIPVACDYYGCEVIPYKGTDYLTCKYYNHYSKQIMEERELKCH